MLSVHNNNELVTFKTIADNCEHCGKRMASKESEKRQIITLIGEITTIIEKYFVCTRCKDNESGRRVIHHSEMLRDIIPLNSKYGYDVEIEIGYLHYAESKQMDEIKSIFKNTYSISVSHSQIHELGIRFLKHMVVNHYLSALSLKKMFESGCVYHVDATCEAGRGMVLSIKEGWTGIILGVWKIPTENEEIIKKHLRSTVELFGEPIAFVSDLGNGMMAAIASLIKEMNLKSHQLVCHMHFLKAVGKSILEDTFKALKSQFRKQKTLAHLNRFVKETGNIIKPQAAAMRKYVTQWQESGAQYPIDGYMESIAVLRAIAQWVIMFNTECDGLGFPFALSHIKLFDRCDIALDSLLKLSEKNHFHEQSNLFIDRLQLILQNPVKNSQMVKTVQDLKVMEEVFTKLREIMRLEKTDVYKQERDKKIPDTLEFIATLKGKTSNFRIILGERLEIDTTTSIEANAICTVLSYFDKYERYLFDHFFVTFDASGGILVKLIERTNNILERSYREHKHQIRRRTGIKNLGFIFEHLFPAAGMMTNLENPIYQQTVLNNKSRNDLVDLFSSLDEQMDYCDTPMFQDDFDLVGGRLPKADKKIVGKSGFTDVVFMLSSDFSNSLTHQYS